MAIEIRKRENGKKEKNDKITLIRFCEEFVETYIELFEEDSVQNLNQLNEQLNQLERKIELENEKQIELKEKLGDRVETITNLGLTTDVLEEKETPSFFRIKYEKLNENGKATILQQEIKELERKIKYFPFRKSKKQLELNKKQLELEKIQKAKSEVEEFDRLSPEDKKEMIEYLKSKEKSESLSSEMLDVKSKIEKIKTTKCKTNWLGYFEVEEDRCVRTLGRMLNEGKITVKDLDDIFRKLDKVGIKARRGEYVDEINCSGAEDYTAEKYSKIMEWFIPNIYEEDEHFLDRNTEEEKSADDDDDGR